VKEITFSETGTEDGSGMKMFSVQVSEPHFFLGRDGEALNALNHLVRRIIESKTPISEAGVQNSSVLIDINGFQKKRIENIHAIAHMMAERARYFKSNIEVDPMSAFERRIVHEFLANENDLKTESTGEGSSRRVVIKYIGAI
jgi:spoIIIJ-associated protein